MKHDSNMMPHYIKAAVIGCVEAHNIEPTQEQIDRAVAIAQTMEKQADGLFMFGCELTKQLLKIVELENNIPWEHSALNFEKMEARKKRRRIGVTEQYKIQRKRKRKEAKQ